MKGTDISKTQIISVLEEFRDSYGVSFGYAEPEAMRIIAKALDYYYGTHVCSFAEI